MELYFLTRGKSQVVDEWANWMSHNFLPFPIKNPASGETVTGLMESQLRPIQLWSFVFPREQLDVVLNTFNLDGGDQNQFVNGYNINPKLWALRKMLGCDPIPKKSDRKDIINQIPLPKERLQHMNILGIGLREDGDIVTQQHERI